jgi:uncharacterized membrane protein (DUF2068 family)
VSLRTWAAWEFRRSIEVSGFIKVIIAERFIKGTALLLGGFALLVAGAGSELDTLVTNVQAQLNFNPHGGSLWSHVVNALILKFGELSDADQIAIAAGAMLYGILECVEGIGLVRRKRWAEYLVLVATVVFLPLEVDELIRRASVVKAGILLLNIAIVVYLVASKRLFLERPPADARVTSAGGFAEQNLKGSPGVEE